MAHSPPFVATSTANLLSEGTRDMTSQQIAEQFDFYGSYFDVNVDRDYVYISFCSLSKYFRQTLAVAEQILLHPLFPEEEVASYREKRKQRLRIERMKQDAEIKMLETESAHARERQVALERTNRLTISVMIASGLAITVLVFFFLQNHRSRKALGQAYNHLRASRSQMQEVMRLSAAYVFLCDAKGRIVQANPSMALALGRSPEQLEGIPLADFLGAEGDTVQADYLRRVTESRFDESILTVRDGRGRDRQWRVISRMPSREDLGENIVGTAVDITEQLEQTEALREQSLRDPLTGCFNRRFLEQFEHASGDQCWALIAFDLDGFKDINDALGHERGDQVLQGMARFLSHRVRSADSLLRLGGDEFLILVPQAEQGVLDRLVQRLDTDRTSAPCGFSMGAELRVGSESLASTLARADAAMYEAKKRQRTR